MNEKELLLALISQSVWDTYMLLSDATSKNLDEVVEGNQTRQGIIQNSFANIAASLDVLLERHDIDLVIEEDDEYDVYCEAKIEEINGWLDKQINKESSCE